MIPITRHSSKKPSLAYWDTMKPSGRVRVKAPNRYRNCTAKNRRYSAPKAPMHTVHTRLGTTRSLGRKPFTASAWAPSLFRSVRALPAIRPKSQAPMGRLSNKRSIKFTKPSLMSKRNHCRIVSASSPKTASARARLAAAQFSSTSAAATASSAAQSLPLRPRLQSRSPCPRQRSRRKKLPKGMRIKPLIASRGSRCPLSPSSKAPLRLSSHHTASGCASSVDRSPQARPRPVTTHRVISSRQPSQTQLSAIRGLPRLIPSPRATKASTNRPNHSFHHGPPMARVYR